MAKKVGSVVLVLVVLALGSVAQASKSRTVQDSYNSVTIRSLSDQPQERFINVAKFQPRTGERFVSIVMDDMSGEPAYGVLSQDVDGDGVADITQEVCGETTSPIAFKPGVKIIVAAERGLCGGQPMGSTFGEVIATFTR